MHALAGNTEKDDSRNQSNKSVWWRRTEPGAEFNGQTNADWCSGDIRLDQRNQPLADQAIERRSCHTEFSKCFGFTQIGNPDTSASRGICNGDISNINDYRTRQHVQPCCVDHPTDGP